MNINSNLNETSTTVKPTTVATSTVSPSMDIPTSSRKSALYNKPIICDKHELEKSSIHLAALKKEVESTTRETLEPKMISKKYHLRARPFDKLWIEVNTPLPRINWDYVKDEHESIKLIKTISRTYTKNLSYSFVIDTLDHPIQILSNSKFTQIQFNPRYHSLPFIQMFLLLFFGEQEFKISHLDVNVDIKMPLDVLKLKIRVGHKSCIETYNPGIFSTTYSPKYGREILLPVSTEYLGKNNKVALYDSGKRHGLGKDFSRVEIRINEQKRIKYVTLDKIESLVDTQPFKNIHLPLSYHKLSNTNEKHIQYFEEFMAEKRITSKEALSEIREMDKSKADSISRALRIRTKSLFDFDAAYRRNFKLFIASTLTEKEKRFIAYVNLLFCSTGSST